jgi:hypothetical protein
MWTNGWTDSHYEPNTRSSEMCEVPDIVHFQINLKYLQDTDLRLLGSEERCLKIP